MSAELPLKSPAPASPGRPKDMVKRAAILQAAKDLFLSLGFEGSSMDAIAAEAGVSKLTVYSHFNDKESLCAAAIEAHCENQLPSVLFDLPEEMPVSRALYEIARRFQGMLQTQEAIELNRLMVAQAKQNPQLTRLFYNAGPQHTQDEMKRLLQQAHDQGKLDIPNPVFASEHFLSAFGGSCKQLLRNFGLESQSDANEDEEYAREIVKRFLRAYRLG